MQTHRWPNLNNEEEKKKYYCGIKKMFKIYIYDVKKMKNWFWVVVDIEEDLGITYLSDRQPAISVI